VICVYIFHRRHRQQQASTLLTERNIKIIASFTDSCDERTILWSDLDALEEGLDTRGIGRKDYDRRKTILQRRLRTLDGNLVNLKNQIRLIESRYTELINRMETAESEIRTLRSTIERSRSQYRVGKLTKRSYMELKNNYDRKLESAKRTIENVVLELKSES